MANLSVQTAVIEGIVMTSSLNRSILSLFFVKCKAEDGNKVGKVSDDIIAVKLGLTPLFRMPGHQLKKMIRLARRCI